ncbi:hypothetical protein ACO2Q9_06775 [Variovorax sp. VNK109]|uniref:hypothetical protein n=1 Tax=Variovorax sp. VNK109 TaxID=3400919 RepID=UPI003C10CB9B
MNSLLRARPNAGFLATTLAFVSALVSASVLALSGAMPANAQTQSQTGSCVTNIRGETVCPPARTVCMQDRDTPEIKCSPRDGGIAHDFYGKASCGPGSCIRDMGGKVTCSRTPGGAAAINMQSEAVCTDGCVPGSASMCTTLSK